MDSSESGQTDGEPSAKRFCIEGGDGQSYVLSVAPGMCAVISVLSNFSVNVFFVHELTYK